MSVRVRRNLYRVFLLVFGLAAVLGTVVIACSAIDIAKTDYAYLWAFGAAVAFLFLMPLNTLTHEAGHLMFGYLAGMRFASIRISRFRLFRVGKKVFFKFLRFKDVEGSCEMYPASAKHVRGSMITYALGGGIINLVVGAVVLVLFFVLDFHPILYFFALFAPLCLLEGLASLFPAEMATGKTDGEVVRGLIKGEASAVISLHVLTAQAIVAKGTFADLDENFLFDVPVVREDDAAYLALLQLRFDYLFFVGEEERAGEQLMRLELLFGYLPELNRADVACDFLYYYSVINPNEEKAEEYISEVAYAAGSCPYYRAMAAYSAMKGEESNYAPKAEELADKDPVLGLGLLEKKFLQRIEKTSEAQQ